MKKPLTKVEQQALSRFRDALQSWLGENLISMRLFSSRARGEQTEESDIDVLVLVQKKDRALCRRIIEESLEVDLTYGMNLSPTILSADEYRQNQDYGTPFLSQRGARRHCAMSGARQVGKDLGLARLKRSKQHLKSARDLL